MLEDIIKKIFGDPDTKKVKKYSIIVEEINKKYEEFSEFSLDDVKSKTNEFRSKFEGLNFQKEEDSVKIKEILESIKIEAVANFKQACTLLNGNSFEVGTDKRKIEWNMIPYDVQLIGGLALNDGGISEMKTGEGKTLVGTIPSYLNALTGNSVHFVTVNDYLAKRDSEEMSILYNALGMTVGVIHNDLHPSAKKEEYYKNIVYATNNELGFDYLRDNMVKKLEDKVQSPYFFAIIDEVDSILIDEARTPLIISMPDSEPTSKYPKFAIIAKKLTKGVDYKIDEKQKAATLTEDGIKKIEEVLKVDNIYVSAHFNDLHHIENAIKASGVYKKDKDYIINGEEIMIVDEHTGRALSGRRYSDGLHQAIEAKEGVKIQQESKTLASITFQNYFRMYWKLSGMTGTAKTEEEEFYKVYALDTLAIPTNEPIIRNDKSDLLFKNEKGKFEWLIEEIKRINKTGQPILVGTVSVDKSEFLSRELKRARIKHNVLNAKYHEHEAEIVAAAGQKGTVTIATNMAGRGTDIKLGEGVTDLGGLYIIGTEKHETRRIDNQLRGRAGRQGDAGATQFLISPNDDIMRIFGGDKLFGIFNGPVFASLPDNEPLARSGMLTNKVTAVQKQVEGHNFDSRKHVLEYDDVMNKHREIIYFRRNKILENENLHEEVLKIIKSQIKKITVAEINKNVEGKNKNIIQNINKFLEINAIDTKVEIDDVEAISSIELSEIDKSERLSEYVYKIAIEELEKLIENASDKQEFYDLEKRILLQSIDELWMLHIDSMTKLREEVAFEGYAQRQPLIVYKEKAFDKFKNLLGDIEYKVTKSMFSINAVVTKDNGINKIEDVEIDDKDLVGILDNLMKEEKSNSNPLFAQPTSTKNKSNKKKIRV
ncbi:MAG: preprotein translocase subunit SecA [Candidatus Gracilibacteria bacterium]|nr:preprotein translocase subunit SecA [Candidatus Gracilibacteria bacterium]